MKTYLLGFLTLIVAAGGTLLAWESSRTSASAQIIAFGSVASQKDQPYFDQLHDGLVSWLGSKGFQPSRTTRYEAQGECYSGPSPTVRPMVVVVSKPAPAPDRGGLSVDVYWEFEGFRWKQGEDWKNAESFHHALVSWIDEYQRQHPKS
jgi:hypothetical protein